MGDDTIEDEYADLWPSAFFPYIALYLLDEYDIIRAPKQDEGVEAFIVGAWLSSWIYGVGLFVAGISIGMVVL